ncbi:MAG: radical SAM protein [Lachnospiraceae bacterium]|nr:radical SAM protein [Lachnospiraceae bacterium]
MLKTAIFGNGIISELVKSYIDGKYNPTAKKAGGEEMQVLCFAGLNSSESATSVPMITVEQLFYELKTGGIQILIIPKENALGQFSFGWVLPMQGISLENVYFADRVSKMNTEDETEILDYFTPFLDTKYLGYLEYHLADHCNLNCKACEHYSSLVPGEVFTEYDKFEKDFTKFHEFIDDIGLVRILGGEPLLNKDINKYMVLTRKLYPNARIHVVTNGLKLLSMGDDFYQTMKENNIEIHISYYPPMKDTMSKVEAFLKEKNIPYFLSPLNTQFGKKQLLKPQNDDDTIAAFYNCVQKTCNNFYDGKVAACFLPFTTKYFNQYFDKDLPEDGAIDIYQLGLTTHALKEQLLLPFLRCRYCSVETEMIPWDVVHEPSTLDDWIRS